MPPLKPERPFREGLDRNYTTKVTDIKEDGSASAAVTVEIMADGKLLATPIIRVNRVGKEAESAAMAQAIANAACGDYNTPSPAPAPKAVATDGAKKAADKK